jgi:ABC-2 type transport system permease protein/oleandomycin transport system permease protein
MVFFGYAFSWVFAYIGLLVKSPEAANSAGFLAVFPLTFISSAFVPIETFPSVLETVAEYNPFTLAVDALRALWLGSPAGNAIWATVVWGVVILVVFATLSINRYRRVTSA